MGNLDATCAVDHLMGIKFQYWLLPRCAPTAHPSERGPGHGVWNFRGGHQYSAASTAFVTLNGAYHDPNNHTVLVSGFLFITVQSTVAMPGRIDRKREISPISSAHVSAIIRPTQGAVCSRRTLSTRREAREAGLQLHYLPHREALIAQLSPSLANLDRVHVALGQKVAAQGNRRFSTRRSVSPSCTCPKREM